MAPLWVMTRAQPDADADVAALRAAGIKAIAVPCIERVALPWPVWTPDGPKVVLVSSSFGALQLIQAWPSVPEPKPILAAMAPATAGRLERASLPVQIHAEGGIVALALAVRDWHRTRGGPLSILYATSDAGTQQPEQEEAMALLRGFARVERAAVYSTRAPEGLDARLQRLSAPICFAFMSPSAVEQALARLDRSFFTQAVACIGQSTYRRFCELAPHPNATHHASFSAFLATLTQEKS